MCQVFNQCWAESLRETMDGGQLSYTKLVLTPSRHPLPQRSSTSSTTAGAIMSTSFQNSFTSLSAYCTVHLYLPPPSNLLHALRVHLMLFLSFFHGLISPALDVLGFTYVLSFHIALHSIIFTTSIREEFARIDKPRFADCNLLII